jgi:NADH-ubiquinone oxidoreductase chain 6
MNRDFFFNLPENKLDNFVFKPLDFSLNLAFETLITENPTVNAKSLDSLYLVNETITNGFISNSLDIVSLIAILCGIAVIISKNPIHSVLFLIGLFVCISSYLIFLGLTFIGLSYLIIYIGAVSILFLFILMLINIRNSELQSNTSNSLPLIVLVSISLISSLLQILPNNILLLGQIFSNNNNITNIMDFINRNLENKLFYVTSKS